MEKEVFTSSELLRDQTNEELFGMVGAFGSSTEKGTVRLTLDMRVVRCEVDEESLTIYVPEGWAHQIAKQILVAAIRLEHLRSLMRFNKLKQD